MKGKATNHSEARRNGAEAVPHRRDREQRRRNTTRTPAGDTCWETWALPSPTEGQEPDKASGSTRGAADLRCRLKLSHARLWGRSPPGKGGQNKQQRASGEPCRKPETTAFGTTAGQGPAFIFDVFCFSLLQEESRPSSPGGHRAASGLLLCCHTRCRAGTVPSPAQAPELCLGHQMWDGSSCTATTHPSKPRASSSQK